MTQSIKKLLCAAIAFVLVFPMAFTNVKANQPVKVFLDGQELAYEVPASIISAHTMVPIGQTITYLTGQVADWNATTKTMTFTSHGKTITHTVGQNVIHIDGVAQAYDTPSLIVNGRTLVPVRMLADATGCQISWDATNKYVIMTSTSDNGGGNNNNNNQPAASPMVLSVSTDKSSVNSGDVVNVTVTTTASTSRVRLANQNDASDVVESTESYLSTNNQKVFTIRWTVKAAGSISARVYAGNTAGYSQDYKSVSISSVQTGVYILDVNVTTKNPEKGKECVVEIVANSTAQRAWLYLQSEGDFANTDTYKVDNSGRRIFTLKWTPKITGTKTLTAYVQDGSGNKDFKKLDLYIGGSSTTSDVSILSYTASPTHAHTGEKIDINVTTNSSAEYVWYVYNGNTSKKDYDYYNSSSKRIFDMSLTVDTYAGADNVLHIYAADNDGNKDHKTIKLTVTDYSDEAPVIHSVTPQSTEISLGDTDRIEIVTNNYIDSVYVEDSDGNSMYAELYASGTSTSKYRVDYVPDSAGQKRLTVTASHNSRQATKSVSINVRSSEEKPNIESVDVPSPIYPGDKVTLNVYMTMLANEPNISLSGGYDYHVRSADVGAGQMTIPVDVYFTDPGRHSITITASNSSGKSSKTISVNVEDNIYYDDDDDDDYDDDYDYN